MCTVKLIAADGLCLDEFYELEDGVVYQLSTEVDEPARTIPDPGEQLLISLMGSWTNAEDALAEIFKAANLPRLGGASGLRGWSSISTYQLCPYRWRMSYLVRRAKGAPRGIDPTSLQIGTLIHTFLAVHYTRMINPTYPLTLQELREACYRYKINPDYVTETWRVITAYFANYEDDYLQPLAIEHRVEDPRHGESCRYDLIARVNEARPGIVPGVYVVEHKSASRFDDATLDGWRNDGEVIGQIDLWDRIKLEKLFGPLQGVLVNILGKQKECKFHRTVVAPQSWQIRDHRKALHVWGARIEEAKATGVFPRSRAACVGRYGKCTYFDHCSGDTNDELPNTAEAA